MLEKYDPGLITGTIGAVIGIILASIFEKTMIVLRFSKLRENLKAEVGGLSQKLRFATDERVFANMQDLVEDGSKMVSEERVDVPHWFCVRGRYRESNKMAKLISKIEAAQSLLEQTLILISCQEGQTSHLLQAHKEPTSSLPAPANQEEASSLPAPANQEEASSLPAPANQETASSLPAPANQEEASHLLQTLASYLEQTSSLPAQPNQEEIWHMLQTLASHLEQTSSLPAQQNQEEIWHMLQTLASHLEQTSSLPTQPNQEEIWHMLQTLASHLEQISSLPAQQNQAVAQTDTAEEMTNEEKPMPAGLRQRRGSRAANAQAVAQTDTAEEMTNEEKPMSAVTLDDVKMVVLKCLTKDQKRILRAMKKMVVLKCVMKDEKSIPRAMKVIANVVAVEYMVERIVVDMKEKKITVIDKTYHVFLIAKLLEKSGFAKQLSVGPAKEETKTEGEKKRC